MIVIKLNAQTEIPKHKHKFWRKHLNTRLKFSCFILFKQTVAQGKLEFRDESESVHYFLQFGEFWKFKLSKVGSIDPF